MATEREPQEITALVGREVYSNNGVYVGEVEDLQLNLDDEVVTALAVTELNPELFEDHAGGARGVLLPYRWVRAVGDVILINDVVERLEDSDEGEVLA
ncbi:MAG: PRC-barrel domain-containing protein [Halobacteriales archaeon]